MQRDVSRVRLGPLQFGVDPVSVHCVYQDNISQVQGLQVVTSVYLESFLTNLVLLLALHVLFHITPQDMGL
jgi:hypothetical protein